MKKKLLALFPSFVGILFFIIAVIVLHRELKRFDFHKVISYISQLPLWRLLLSLFFCILSYSVICINEALLFKHIKYSLPFRKIAFVSFISTAISHNIGYSIISAGSLRYRYYKPMGVSMIDITTFIGLHGLFFWIGFFLLGGSIFLIKPLPISPSLHLPFNNSILIAILFLMLFTLFYFAVFKKFSFKIRSWTFSLPNFKLSTFLVLTSILEWCFAGSALYILLPSALKVTLFFSLGIYLLAQILGVGSQVPGGLGVFETVFMGLLGFGAHAPSVLGALLVYRGFYYLLPLIISAILMALYEFIPGRRN